MKQDKIQLFLSAFVKVVLGVALIGMLLFLPAGTLAFDGAWRLCAVLFVPMLAMGVAMFIFSPELLRRRLASKEERTTQQGVVRYTGLLFIISFVVAGLDFRFGWSQMAEDVVWGATILFLVGYGLYGEVMRENVWLSRNITVEDGQQVVSTGLYAIVRHPMYTSTIVMFLAMPLVLGSYWATLPMLFYIPIIALRIKDEEQLLRADLKGYTEYCAKVHWRLLPFIW
ncbi:MAG: isoprenylcysteine carboxylmethyltransferase family protein [Alistipes sp.]|nr:isoprenylcysteine carboxylmethyltransferase family protein [Alistipes sp.]